jgi:hypothetical protein
MASPHPIMPSADTTIANAATNAAGVRPVLSNKMTEDYLNNLMSQKQVYGQVHQVLLQKKVSILQQALEQFAEQDETLRQLRKQALQLEKQREQLQQVYWPGQATVQAAEIRQAFPEPQRATFDGIRRELKQTLHQVQQAQHQVEQLLQDSLQWVNQSVALLKQHLVSGTATTYTAQGVTRPQLPTNTVETQG